MEKWPILVKCATLSGDYMGGPEKGLWVGEKQKVAKQRKNAQPPKP